MDRERERKKERQKEEMFCSIITTAAVVDVDAELNLVEDKSTVEAFFILFIHIYLYL